MRCEACPRKYHKKCLDDCTADKPFYCPDFCSIKSRSAPRLVWATFDVYPPWPARVCHNNDTKVTVQFFGQNDEATVYTTSVENYGDVDSSKIRARSGFDKELWSGFERAVDECEQYAQYLKSRTSSNRYNCAVTALY